MSDLVGNPEDRFSRVAAQLILGQLHVVQKLVKNVDFLFQ